MIATMPLKWGISPMDKEIAENEELLKIVDQFDLDEHLVNELEAINKLIQKFDVDYQSLKNLRRYLLDGTNNQASGG
jgi:hypothetical protein